jgi:hypothetical protein
MYRGAFGIAALVLAAAGGGSGLSATPSAPLFADSFNRPNGPNGLITNEYAYRHPDDAHAVRSKLWETTSGSFFSIRGVGSTGVPDGCAPDVYSQRCTDSAVFRLRTLRTDFGNVAVSFRLINHGLTSTARTPPAAIDGVHVWVRYESPTQLYAASVNRRDGSVVIKKKCPGGPSNGGTYYTLGKSIRGQPIPLRVWQNISVSVRNDPAGTVTIAISRNGTMLDQATDNGIGCAALTRPGAIGIRGDNDDFGVETLTVTGIS